MKLRYEIARYRSDHKEQVLRLLEDLWGRHSALNRAYFEWKYEGNPFIREPAICLALHQGEVIGMYGIVGASWRFGTSGRRHDIPFSDDLVVAPKHRHRGVASALVRAVPAYAADLGYPFLLCLRANPITTHTSLAAGYRNIGALEPVHLRGRRRANLHGVSSRLQRARFLWRFANSPLLVAPSDRWPFRDLDRSARGPRLPDSSPISIERTPMPDAMAALAELLPHDDRIGHVRDRDFLEWVFRNPRMEYRYLYWIRERLEGFLVLHRILPPGPRLVNVWVSEWEGSSAAVRRELLDTARSGRFERLVTWTTTLTDSARAMLDRSGFEPMDPEARARGRPAALIRVSRDDELDHEWTMDGRRLLDIGNWKFRPLDQD